MLEVLSLALFPGIRMLECGWLVGVQAQGSTWYILGIDKLGWTFSLSQKARGPVPETLLETASAGAGGLRLTRAARDTLTWSFAAWYSQS